MQLSPAPVRASFLNFMRIQWRVCSMRICKILHNLQREKLEKLAGKKKFELVRQQRGEDNVIIRLTTTQWSNFQVLREGLFN